MIVGKWRLNPVSVVHFTCYWLICWLSVHLVAELLVVSSGILSYFFRFLLLAYAGLMSSQHRDTLSTALFTLVVVFAPVCDVAAVLEGVFSIESDAATVYIHTASSASLRLQLGPRLVSAVAPHQADMKKFRAALKILHPKSWIDNEMTHVQNNKMISNTINSSS